METLKNELHKLQFTDKALNDQKNYHLKQFRDFFPILTIIHKQNTIHKHNSIYHQYIYINNYKTA